jgi:hypothetical protein
MAKLGQILSACQNIFSEGQSMQGTLTDQFHDKAREVLQ